MREVESISSKGNGRKIAVYYLSPSDIKKKRVFKGDCIGLRFDAQSKENYTVYMRPDEALMVAGLLVNTVWKITKSYCLGLVRQKKSGR